MYILVVSDGFPNNNSPLNGIFEFDQAKSLHNLGHKVIFVSIDLRSIRRLRKWGLTVFEQNGVSVFNLSIPIGNLPKWILLYVGYVSLLFLYSKIYVKYGKPDIVHSHFTLPSAIASILKIKYKLPLIITEHSSEITKVIISKGYRNLACIAYKNADKIISVSSALATSITRNFGFESIIIPNIVDVSLFKFRPKPAINHFTFISIGHLVYGKGHDLLIDAFHKANFDSEVKLLIIGDGPLYKTLQSKIISLGLSSQVDLKNQMNRADLINYMHKCDVFVLASRGETFGVVYIEAMAAGLPIIATACGGPEDFVEKNNGIMIPVNDISSLSEAMRSMYLNISKYRKEDISKNAREKFSPNTVGLLLEELYNKVLKN
jgi:glycosyltransferase involved in cell wall biosynthesis